MLIFTEAQPPQLSPLIQYVIEEKIETPPPIITWQDNPNNCDQTTQYIAIEEPFYCIEKPRAYTQTKSTQSNTNTAPNGWYKKGQCTWYVSTKRQVGQWNDATDWLWQAKRDGYATGSTPQVGAIAWQYGHVSYVEAVNSNGTITISEANYDYKGSIRTINVDPAKYTYIY